MTEPRFTDDLARQLWDARRRAQPIAPMEPIGVPRGERVAAELYAALRAAGATQVAWKLALTDPAAQARFGTNEPFSAPVYDRSVITDGTLRRSSFTAPLLEAEIAIVVDRAGRHAAACVEIADCRIRDWKISVGEGLADFGLHGAMQFGETHADVAVVGVVVRHDGMILAQAEKPVDPALELVRWLEDRRGSEFTLGDRTRIATGSIIKPIPLTAGRWELDFGPLGRLELDVTP